MRSLFQSYRPMAFILLMSTMPTVMGCAGDLWNRISELEQQMATMAADHRVLPQQIETLQIKIQTMDQEVRSRQSRVLTEIEHFRNEDLAHFSQRLESLAQNFQSFRKEMVSSAPWEQIHAEVADAQAALSRMKVSLDQIQAQHDAPHSQTTKRTAVVTKPASASDTKAAAKTP